MWVQCKSCNVVLELKKAQDHLNTTGHISYTCVLKPEQVKTDATQY